jgi:hypothetical protein
MLWLQQEAISSIQTANTYIFTSLYICMTAHICGISQRQVDRTFELDTLLAMQQQVARRMRQARRSEIND